MVEVIIAMVILGLALLIRSFVNPIIELQKPFFIIVGIFLVLYIGAVIFVSSRVGNGLAQNQIPASSDGYSIEQQLGQ